MFNDKKLKNVSDAVSKIMEASVKEELKGDQHKIDANKNNKVDAHDFKLLRAGKKVAKEEVEQVEEGIEDKLEAARAKAKAAGKPVKGPAKAEKSNVTKVAGKAYGGSAQKDDDENDEDDEPKKASKKGVFKRRYNTKVYKEQFSHLLDSYINGGLKSVMEDLEVVEEDVTEETLEEGLASWFQNKGVEKFTKLLDKGHPASEIATHIHQMDSKKRKDIHSAITKHLQKNNHEGLKKLHGMISTNEEVDNETFTKEVQAQKEKAEGKGKKADIAAAAVQAVTKEEAEQIEELSKSTLLRYQHKAGAAAQKHKDNAKTYDRLFNTGATRSDAEKTSRITKSTWNNKGLRKRSQMDDSDDDYSAANLQHKLAKKREDGIKLARVKSIPKPHNEDVEQVDEISKSTYVGAMQTLSDPDTDRGHHDTDDKLISRAKKQHGEKFAKDLQGVYKTHWPRANQADGRDKLKSSATVRTTQSGKANKQDVKTKSKEIQSRLGTHKKPNLPEQVEERTLTEPEMNKREDVVKGMKKNIAGFKERYGSRAKDVMYGAATKVAKGDK